MGHTVIQALASAVEARANCIASGNAEWRDRWEQTIHDIEKEYLPSGSGFDAGCKVELDRSNARRIIIVADFHHMNGAGYYDGWTVHDVTVTPAFDGIDIRIGGRDRDGWKEYAADTFEIALSAEYKES